MTASAQLSPLMVMVIRDYQQGHITLHRFAQAANGDTYAWGIDEAVAMDELRIVIAAEQERLAAIDPNSFEYNKLAGIIDAQKCLLPPAAIQQAATAAEDWVVNDI